MAQSPSRRAEFIINRLCDGTVLSWQRLASEHCCAVAGRCGDAWQTALGATRNGLSRPRLGPHCPPVPSAADGLERESIKTASSI